MALSIAEPADHGSIDIANSTVVDGTSTITVQPYKTFGTTPTFWWYYFTIGGANTRTPIIDILSANYFNAGATPTSTTDPLARKGCWSYDGLTWFDFDNVSFQTSPGRFRFSNNTAFNQATVHVAHYPTYTWARAEAQIATWLASSYIEPTASGDVDGVFASLSSVSNGFGKTCPAADLYAFKLHDAAQTGTKNVCVLNHTVHVGETPAAYAFAAAIDFLISSDVRAQFLRKHWIFYCYPEINPQGRYGGLYRNAPGMTTTESLGGIWDTPSVWPPLEDDIQPTIIADTGGTAHAFFDFHSYNAEVYNANYRDVTLVNSPAANAAWEKAMQAHEPAHHLEAFSDSGNPRTWALANLNSGSSLKIVATVEAAASKDYGIAEYQRFGRRLMYALAHATEPRSASGVAFPVTATDTAGRVFFS